LFFVDFDCFWAGGSGQSLGEIVFA